MSAAARMILVCVLLASFVRADDIAQGRALASYDRGGEFHEGEPSTKQRRPIERITNLRQFIWRHWHDKRRGYVTLSESAIDAGWTTHIFIEPGTRGEWHVVLRVVSSSFLPPGEGSTPYPDHISELPEVTALIYARRKSSDAPGSHVLVFRAADGKEVWRL